MNYSEFFTAKGISFNDNENNDGIEGRVIDHPKYHIIYFFPTNSNLDWVTNLTFFPELTFFEKTKLKVHSGWYNEYKISHIRDQIEGILKTFKKKKPIVIVGYSKGCGTTYMFLLDILKEELESKIEKVILFGAPKGLNKKGKKLIEQNFIIENIQINGDIVCKVPNALLTLITLLFVFCWNVFQLKIPRFSFFRTIGKKTIIGPFKLITANGHHYKNYIKYLNEEAFQL